MTTYAPPKTEIRVPAPELRGAALALGSCQDREVCIEGSAGTGKTVGALFKIHVLLSRYPGARALVARKTNTALSGSAMVTYRDNILRGRRDIRWFGGNKVEPAAYRYPNGSKMIVNGLDKPEKVMSSEFEWAYINEAIECELDDIEFVRIRLRPRTNGPNVPYRQLIMDVNPDAPEHWLNLRMNEGITTRLTSRHQDNPRYWDAKTQDWTEEGREYIFGILEGLTGVRRARFLYGLWVAAEGSVYEDSWDRRRNVIDSFPIPKEWPRYMIVDFGFTNPFCCKWYAMDGDGRGYVYRELYHTKRLVEDHAKQIKHHSRWGQEHGDPLPRAVICDHDAEDRATLERHLGLYTIPAQKNVSAGIQVTASRYRAAGDGRPRLMYFRDCLVERDRDLVSRKKPTCSIEEVDGYIWDTRQGVKKGEAPLKEDDHGMDCDRYFCAHFDLKPSVIRYSARIY